MVKHYPMQDLCLAVVCGTPVLALIVVLLRFYARRRKGTELGWDDWSVAVAVFLSLALIAPAYMDVKMWHKGIHIWDVPQDQTEPDLDYYFIVMILENVLTIPILPLVKASIIMLLLRVGSVLTNVRRALHVVMAFNILTCLIPWIFLVFECPPQTGRTWKPRTFGNLHCLGRVRAGYLLVLVNCTNLLTDILIFPIPFFIMRKALSLSVWARTVVVLLFASGAAVTGISAAKIWFTYRDRIFSLSPDDWTYNIDFCVTYIENNVAIIIACVPTVRHLVYRRQDNRSRLIETSTSPGRQPSRLAIHPSGSNSKQSSRFGDTLAPTEHATAGSLGGGIKVTTEVELTGRRKDSAGSIPSKDTWDGGWTLSSAEYVGDKPFLDPEGGDQHAPVPVYEVVRGKVVLQVAGASVQ